MNNNLPLSVSLLISGISGGIAEFLTNPFDFTKVRKQLNTTNHNFSIIKLIQENGVSILCKGSLIGVQRQIIFNTLRIGLFPPVQAILFNPKLITFPKRIISGMITGAISVSVISPLDKIRVQLQSNNTLDKNNIFKIIQSNTIVTLYKGFLPNLLRSTIASGIQLSSYSHFKNNFMKYFKKNSSYPHILSSIISGFLVACVIQPIDCIKTRSMNALKGRNSSQSIYQIIKSEGISATYKGFNANFIRICSWQLICFYSIEILTSRYNGHKLKKISHNNT